MASIESLNLDCLFIVFSSLDENDFASISLVSRSLMTKVAPRLYRTLVFHARHAQRFTRILSPFVVVAEHCPSYTAYVRHIDVRAVPLRNGNIHPNFLDPFIKAITMSEDLVSFTCTPSILVPPSLAALQNRPSIVDLRVNAKLVSDEADNFLALNNLRSIALDGSTWNIIDVLPRWTSIMHRTLIIISFHSLDHLNHTVLDPVISNLPNLVGLHVVNCAKINWCYVLKLTLYTPNLESLAFSCWDRSDRKSEELDDIAPLHHLRHFAIENHDVSLASGLLLPKLPFSALVRAWGAPLTSFVYRSSQLSALVTGRFISDLLDACGPSLLHVTFLHCKLNSSIVGSIASRCPYLERLELNFPPVKEIRSFAKTLSCVPFLHTLQDFGDAPSQGGARPVLTKDNVRILMKEIAPLRTVIAWDRVWTGHKGWFANAPLELTFEKRRNPTPSHWFVPPAS